MNNRIVTFHILLAAQFALVAANIIMNIKIGLFSMIFILLLTTTCLIQLNNDEQTNWKPGRNIMTYLFVAWLLFYFLEFAEKLILIVWSVFVIIFTIKGYWQKSHGFSSKDLHFLFSMGGARTHIIWSGIRYFSCFTDAANYGVHCAMFSPLAHFS